MKCSDALDVLELLQCYYARQLVNVSPDAWRLLEPLAQSDFALNKPTVARALRVLCSATPTDVQDFKFEYNRLFVGPDSPLAAPYATRYLSEEQTLMRGVTLAVRDEYARFGMATDARNVEPDDHFAYELSFVSLLISSDDTTAKQTLKHFLEQHICVWLTPHTQAIRNNTANCICLAFADLLEATMLALKQSCEDFACVCA